MERQQQNGNGERTPTAAINTTTTLWDGDEPPELRLPHSAPGRQITTTTTTTAASVTAELGEMHITADPRLKVDAAVFVPLAQRQQPQPPVVSSVQDRLRSHKTAAETTANSQQHRRNDCDDFVDSPDDVRLQHLIVTLTKDAGQFADLLDIFMDTLSPYFDDILILARAAQLLVNQAIEYPSFRYTGARLCCYIEQFCPEFRAELHLTCKKELQSNPNKSGLLLFVAELYTQLHHENIYGTYLIDAFKLMLDIGGNDNVKSVCQALKLTGHSLDKYDKKALDEVFSKLSDVKPTTTGTSLSLINSVVNLRSSMWGHTSPANSSSAIEMEPAYWNDAPQPVFYNSDGSKFTSEECDFLAANMTLTEEYLTDASDPDELCDPEPEMDEEIQAAFRDFVKLSKR